jgi:hypothetical protein
LVELKDEQPLILQTLLKTAPHPVYCRQELYPMKYERIDWNAARNLVAKEDMYYPHPWIQVGGRWRDAYRSW